MGPHVLGACGQPRPGALGAPARRNPRGGRRGDLLGQRGGRPQEHQRLRHAPQPGHGGDLHERVSRRSGAVAGLQHRPRPDLDQVRRQSGARRPRSRVPRSEGVLVRARGRVAHGRRQGRPAQGCDLSLRRFEGVGAPQRLRARQRRRRRLGVPRPVPAAGRRQAQAAEVGDDRQPQPRRDRRRLGHAVLRRRLRRHDVHGRQRPDIHAPGGRGLRGLRGPRLRRLDHHGHGVRQRARDRHAPRPADRVRIRGRSAGQQLHRLRLLAGDADLTAVPDHARLHQPARGRRRARAQPRGRRRHTAARRTIGWLREHL